MNPDFIFFDFSLLDSMSCVSWACDPSFPGDSRLLMDGSSNLVD